VSLAGAPTPHERQKNLDELADIDIWLQEAIGE